MPNGDSDLPTIAQIKAATEVLSQPDVSAKVVRIDGRFAVKFRTSVSLSEAEAMRFISSKSQVPIPKVLSALSEPETGIKFIVMEFVPGTTLQDAWDTLTAKEKSEIATQVKNSIDELRKIEPPDYLGGISHRPFTDGIFWVSDHNPAISGPVANQSEMNEGILQRLQQTEPAPYVKFMRGLIKETFHGHRTVLTHGDLQPKNIMINRIGTQEDGSGRLEVTIVDWEMAGWYPEYWEFCSATIACRWKPDWLEMVQRILNQYPKEYLLMQVIYSIVFY